MTNYSFIEKKRLYALCRSLDPYLNHVWFAKTFGVAYGTARNWKNDPVVKALIKEINYPDWSRSTSIPRSLVDKLLRVALTMEEISVKQP